MSSDLFAIEVDNVSKCYQVYDNPFKRLKEIIVPKKKAARRQSRTITS